MKHFTVTLFMYYSMICLFLASKIGPIQAESSLVKTETQSSSSPNVIIFFVDDLGYGDLGYTGHPTSRTPNIDALAADSRILTHFYVPSPVCSPSRAALLTGRYQVRSGTYPGVYVPDSVLGLPKNETTIAKLLKKQGYKTQIVGKWHLGIGYNREFLPTNPAYGFDNYLGIPYSNDECPCPICFPNNGSCLEECWDIYVSCPLFHNKDIVEQPVYLPSLTPRLVSTAVEFINEADKEKAPFFLYFPFHHIHRPQFSSKEFFGKNDRGPTGDSLLELDWAIGTVMKTIEKLNMIDNTIVWFTSDNGPCLHRHERGGSSGLLRCGKGTTWEGGVRVPTFVHWPTKIAAGKSNALTSSIDILPTISNIVGANTSNLTLDGVDISSVLFDNSVKSPRNFFAVYPQNPAQESGPFAVIYNQYKAHFYTKGSDLSDPNNYDAMCFDTTVKHDPPLLFNLYMDPGERYDLGQNDEYREIVTLISEWRKEHMKKMTWMVPRTSKKNKRAEVCCNDPFCSPLPKCCDCTTPKAGFWNN